MSSSTSFPTPAQHASNAPAVPERRSTDELTPAGKTETRTGSVRDPGWTPLFLTLPMTVTISAIFILVAIMLEIVAWRSHSQGGFSTGMIQSTEVVQFLKSFVPNFLFVPIVLLLEKAYLEVRVLQPYVVLSRGNAEAKDSINLDYITKNPAEAGFESVKLRHWVVSGFSALVLWSLIFEPLSGALFYVKLRDHSSTTTLMTGGSLGVNAIARGSPATFLAAAGFVDAKLYNGGILPPYLFTNPDNNADGFMIPPFNISGDQDFATNGSASVSRDTQILGVHVECVPASSVSSIAKGAANGDTTFQFNVTLGSNNSTCSESVNGTISGNYGGWIGIMASADPSCIPLMNSSGTAPPIPTGGLDPTQNPFAVAFTANASVASAAFCFAYQKVYNASVTFGLIANRVNSPPANLVPVESSSLEGYMYNGVNYPAGSALQSIQGLDQAIGLALGDSVIENAGKLNSTLGLNTTAQNEVLSQSNDVLASLVQNAVRAYMLVSTSSLFIQGPNQRVQGTLFTQVSRVYAYQPAIHTLAVLCAMTGLALAALFFLHARERSHLHLVDRPVTIGAIGGILSGSRLTSGDAHRGGPAGMGLLGPTDDEAELHAKMDGKRFGIDEKTGIITVHEYERPKRDEEEGAGVAGGDVRREESQQRLASPVESHRTN